MTLQQLEYIVAVDKYRHFVRAAEACGVTQSTLSSMIQKLETELDTQIFDRNSHPVRPTAQGENIIRQAQVVLFNAAQMKEMVLTERQQETGELHLGVIPTIAPYIIPKLIKHIHSHHKQVRLRLLEARTSVLTEKLERAEIDIALLATPLDNPNLLEIPLYYEKFKAYISPDEPLFAQQEIDGAEMPGDRLWILAEGHCLRNQVLNFCHRKSRYSSIYEAGSIDTLVKIVDENGGYTIIPELHTSLLTDEQKERVRNFRQPEPVREVSLVVRNDYIRERMLNLLADSIRTIVPDSLVDPRLKKFAIKL